MSVSNSISLTAKQLFNRSLEVLNTSSVKGFEMALEARNLAEEEKEFELTIEIDLQLANLLRKRGNSFECIERLNLAYRLVNNHLPNNKHLMAEVYREFGSVYIDGLNDYATGLEYFYKCLSLDNPVTNSRLYPSMSYAFICTKQYDKAAKYLALGEKINTEQKQYDLLSFVFENKADMYVRMGRIEMAVEIYKLGIATANKGIAIDGEFSYAFVKSLMLTELARCHIKLGHPEKIHQLLEDAFQITSKYELNQIRTSAALIKAEYLLEKKEYNTFLALFDKEVAHCSNHALHTDLNKWYQKMIDLSENLGDYKNGLKFSKLLNKNKADYEQKTKAINVTKVLENKEREIISLQERNREIELQKQEIEQFAYIVAHDLKTPLSNISNFGGLFLKSFKDKIDSKNQEYLNLVIDSAHQMHNMLDELLRYTSVEKVTGKLYPTDVEKVIESIKHNFILEKPGIVWPEVSFEDLPKVIAHPKHIFLVLDRMIRNSIKFCKKDLPPKININIRESRTDFHFALSDNGIGIEPAFRTKVFELFKQLDKVDYTGTGMGLALCKKIVNTYGGKITVEDSELGGVSFEFNIPKRN